MTDADLLLGRIPADAPLPELGRLDRGAARRAHDAAGVDAAGVVAVVDASMTRAVRAVTVERGVDPRGCALVAFGGAGPLHAVAIAEALAMPAVVVPPRAGAFSAVGLLGAPERREVVRTWAGGDDAARAVVLTALGDEVGAKVGAGAVVNTAVDCRYVGQSHEITVTDPADFPAEHERRNGHRRPGVAVEVVALRARAERRAPLGPEQLPAPARGRVVGPAVAPEPDCTAWIPEGWVAEPGPLGAWIVTRT